MKMFSEWCLQHRWSGRDSNIADQAGTVGERIRIVEMNLTFSTFANRSLPTFVQSQTAAIKIFNGKHDFWLHCDVSDYEESHGFEKQILECIRARFCHSMKYCDIIWKIDTWTHHRLIRDMLPTDWGHVADCYDHMETSLKYQINNIC